MNMNMIKYKIIMIQGYDPGDGLVRFNQDVLW